MTVDLNDPREAAQERHRTGVPGLDDVLHGGLPVNNLYLVIGRPGTGKTTLGLQFLLEGVRNGESVLYITLSENRQELETIARSHGWDLSQVEMYDLSEATQLYSEEALNTVFPVSEVDLPETTNELMETIREVKPSRVVFDSLGEMRLLAGDPLMYRRQVLLMKQQLAGWSLTTLMLDEDDSGDRHDQLLSLCYGAIRLQSQTPEFGRTRRKLEVLKLRGSSFREGYHDYTLQRGGMSVYPSLVAAEHRVGEITGCQPTGVEGLDRLLHGGYDEGTASLIMGPAGTFKSLLTLHYLASQAAAGRKSLQLLFDERLHTVVRRAGALGIPFRRFVEEGLIRVRQIDPTELSQGQLDTIVREAVEEGVRTVVIDSLNGFVNAMPHERYVILQLHELLTYLGQHGVTSLLVLSERGLAGQRQLSGVDLSYLSDTVIVTRYVEMDGVMEKVLTVFKRRSGDHERTTHLLEIGPGGLRIARRLRGDRGIGAVGALMDG